MAFYRKGTVSKASGPIHINSYALRSVPIKYKPPIFIPDLLFLPVDWKKPEMFSRERFQYNYSTETRVLEQAKSRALSVAAEASLQRRQVEEILKKQREKAEAEAKAKELAKPRPPIDFSNDILTPTPVFSSSSASGSSVSSKNIASAPQLDEDDLKESNRSNSPKTQVPTGTTIASLGEMSLREFEATTSDPFEIASLQAINDMEVLQSVLQPIPPPVITSLVSSSSTVVTTAPQTQTSETPPISELGHDTVTLTQPSPLPTTTTHTRTEPVSPRVSRNTFYPDITQPATSTTTPLFQPSPATVPPQSGALASNQSTPLLTHGLMSFEDSFVNNSKTATVSMDHLVSSPGTVSSMTGGLSTSETGVGLLIDISGNSVGNKDTPHPLPPVRRLYNVQVDQPQGTSPSPFSTDSRPHPVPKPRTNLPAVAVRTSSPSLSTTVSGYSPTSQHPSSAQSLGDLSPTIPLKIVSHTLDDRSSPLLPPKGIKPKRNAPVHVGFTIPSSSPSAQTGSNRLRMGVQVLPPIPDSSTPFPVSTTQLQFDVAPNTPPAYEEAQSSSIQPRISAPPPYSPSGHGHKAVVQPPQPSQRAYNLPDPQASLTSSQRADMESLTGMGFPVPRVARAVMRYGDNTKVLDFLFLVGQLEEERYSGDSAETALTACEEDLDKAREYLKRVEGFKEIGFQESKIHKAHERSSGDWDKALDFLTEGR